MTNSTSQHLLILINASLLVFSQLMFKQGMKQGPPVSLASLPDFTRLIIFVITTPQILAGLSLSAASMLLWLITLSRLELSYALPMLSGVYYILAIMVSLLFLNEPFNHWRLAGTLLITLGVSLLARSA